MIPSLLIIGAGPGGVAAAAEAVRQKRKVTLVENHQTGGTCLNRGCIPSKSLLAYAKSCSPETLAEWLVQKTETLNTLRDRSEQSLKRLGIERVQGVARLLSGSEAEIQMKEGSRTISFDAAIIATGSSPVLLPVFPTTHPAVFDSTSILSLEKIPRHLVVVGGGYIGCEMACAFRALGSQVTLLEKEPRLLPGSDLFEVVSRPLSDSFQKQGIRVLRGTKIDRAEDGGSAQMTLRLSNGETLESDAVLCAAGRAANTDQLLASSFKLQAHPNGKIAVNEFMQTSVPNIYAVGDVASPVPLAHVATAEGELAVKHLSKAPCKPIDYARVPQCVYTYPEVAAIGFSEKQAVEKGLPAKSARAFVLGSSRGIAERHTEGMINVVYHTQTEQILGAQLAGPHATELIHLPALAMQGGLTLKDFREMIFAHPTYAESFQELAFKTQK